MGNFFSQITSPISSAVDQIGLGGLFGTSSQQKAANNYQGQMAQAKADLDPMYQKAQNTLQTGTDTATQSARTGFQTARRDTASGYNTANQQLQSGGQGAINTAKAGYKAAQGQYNTPEMVSSRAELYNRILGNGGLSQDVLNQQAGKTREEYGSGLRGAMEATSAFQGDSGASGLAQENLARAATTLGTNRANSIRDINVGNAQLARQEQTGAIASAQSEALQRAGLNAQEAQTVSGIQEKLAEGGANLTAQETNALSQLASQEGTTVADLQAKLAAGSANLTSEEAKALAEITTGAATAGLQAGSQKNFLQSLWG